MKKTFIITLAVQFVVILILAVFSMVQLTEAKKQQMLAREQVELAIRNAKVANEQAAIATNAQIELDKCKKAH